MKKLFTLLAILVPLIILGAASAQQASLDLFQKALVKEKAEGNLEEAIALFQKVVDKGEDEALAAQAQLHIGMCYEKLGLGKARDAYQKVIERFPKQAESVRAAREKLAQLQKGLMAEKAEDKSFKIRLVASNFGSRFGLVSPEGTSLAIMDSQSGDLAIRDLKTGQMKRLTKKGSWATAEMFLMGQWSPDGKKIAYAWFNKDNYPDLRLVGTDGSEPRILFDDKECEILPTGWSPDGKFILAVVRKKAAEFQIILVSAADGSVQVLKTSPKPVGSGSMIMGFSPDGKYIAYDAPQKENASENDIFLLSRDGKQEIRIAEHPAQDKFLGWVPKSNVILFSSDRALSMDVWMIHIADGKPVGEPVLVKKDIGTIQPLGITDRGSLYYGAGSYLADLYEAGVDLDKGVIVDPPKKLSQKFFSPIYYPKWSADGKSLAYLVERREAGKPSSFFICVRSGETERNVPISISSNWGLDWSSDGRSFFAAVTDKNGRQGLFRIDSQTGGLTLLSQSEPDSLIKVFAVAPDAKSIYYASFQWKKKLSIIIERNLATGQEKELYRKAAPPDIGNLAVSQDSRYLSFSTSDAAANAGYVIRIIDLADGKSRDILQGKLGSFAPHVWMRDGKSILFIKRASGSSEEKNGLWRVSAAGGEPTKIDLGMAFKSNVDISPDEKRIIYTDAKLVLEIWAMENFLPQEKSAGPAKSR